MIIVPRRAGKTWLLLNYALTVGRRRPMAQTFYASHRRETAAAMWRDDWFPKVELSPLHPRYVQLRRSNGSEAISWRHNRSTFRLLPPDGDAMRSFSSDLAMVDEAREFTLQQGLDFEAAAFPTQATGAGGQFWIVSNAGTATSEWLARWRDLGRTSIDNPDSEICYIEYCARPDVDRDDPATWIATHPGLGHHVNLDALAADHETMHPDQFAAEYLGIWTEALIDQELVAAWNATVAAAAAPADPVTFAVETSYDRDRTVIVAVGSGTSPAVCVAELLEDQVHGQWVIPRLAELVDKHRPAGIVWDAGGPVAALTHELAELPANLIPFTTHQVTAAAGAWHDRIIGHGVEHRDDTVMQDAVAAARRRTAGGAWLFDRRAPGSLPLIASSLAAWHWADGRTRPPNVT